MRSSIACLLVIVITVVVVIILYNKHAICQGESQFDGVTSLNVN